MKRIDTDKDSFTSYKTLQNTIEFLHLQRHIFQIEIAMIIDNRLGVAVLVSVLLLFAFITTWPLSSLSIHSSTDGGGDSSPSRSNNDATSNANSVAKTTNNQTTSECRYLRLQLLECMTSCEGEELCNSTRVSKLQVENSLVESQTLASRLQHELESIEQRYNSSMHEVHRLQANLAEKETELRQISAQLDIMLRQIHNGALPSSTLSPPAPPPLPPPPPPPAPACPGTTPPPTTAAPVLTLDKLGLCQDANVTLEQIEPVADGHLYIWLITTALDPIGRFFPRRAFNVMHAWAYRFPRVLFLAVETDETRQRLTLNGCTEIILDGPNGERTTEFECRKAPWSEAMQAHVVMLPGCTDDS